MKNGFKIMMVLLSIFTFIFMPKNTFAEGLNLKYIVPEYDLNSRIVLNENDDNYNFNFTFGLPEQTMIYKAVISNDTDKDIYINSVGKNESKNNYDFTVAGIYKDDIIPANETKIIKIYVTSTTKSVVDVDDIFNLTIDYDDAENHKKVSEPITNPKTGVYSYLGVLLIAFALFLIYLKTREKSYFRHFMFIIMLVPILGGIIYVYAEGVEGTLLINGLIKYSSFEKICIDDENNNPDNLPVCTGGNEDYGIYRVSIDPNGGTYKNSPEKYIANYLINSVIDLGKTYRQYYKLVDWVYNGKNTSFEHEDFVVKENSELIANWEYGPYYLLTINPSNGVYDGTTKKTRLWFKDKETYTLKDATRDKYVFYKWEESTNTNSLNKNVVTIKKSDVDVLARWSGIFNVNFDPGAEDATVSINSKEVATHFEYGELPTPKRSGYTFTGWYLDNSLITKDTIYDYEKDVTLVAKWDANKDTKYKVNHYLMNVEGNADKSTYILKDTDNLTGVTDSKVSPKVKQYTGFTSPDVEEVKIYGDESLVLNYYYTRNKYKVTVLTKNIEDLFYKNESGIFAILENSGSIRAYYDSDVKMYALSKPGYYYSHNKEEDLYLYRVPANDSEITIEAAYCSDGYSGQGAAKCSACPAGYSCENPEENPKICPAGQYSEVGSDKCSVCPAGTSSKEGSGSCSTCPDGTYSEANSSVCTKCPTGYSCEKPSEPPKICPAGQYSDEGSSSCSACPAGYICPTPGGKPEACPANTYSKAGATTCTACPTGHSSNKAASECSANPYDLVVTIPKDGIDKVYYKYGSLTSYSTTSTSNTYKVSFGSSYYLYSGAKAGYYVNDSYTSTNPKTGVMGTETVTYAPTATKCAAGYSCPGGTEQPIKCKAGTFSDEGAKSCTSCPAGTYSKDGATSCTACPAGSSCSDPSKDPISCKAGTYSTKGAATCTTCSAGTYSADNAGSCSTCAANTYSAAGSSSCTACATGYESAAGAGSCSIKKFNVTYSPSNAMTSNNSTISKSKDTVEYGGLVTTTVTPKLGYYISAMSCTNNYQSSFTEDYISPTVKRDNYKSVATVRNNNQLMDTICTYSVTNVTASMVNYSNSTYTTCKTAQCAVDDIYSKMKAKGL